MVFRVVLMLFWFFLSVSAWAQAYKIDRILWHCEYKPNHSLVYRITYYGNSLAPKTDIKLVLPNNIKPIRCQFTDNKKALYRIVNSETDTLIVESPSSTGNFELELYATNRNIIKLGKPNTIGHMQWLYLGRKSENYRQNIPLPTNIVGANAKLSICFSMPRYIQAFLSVPAITTENVTTDKKKLEISNVDLASDSCFFWAIGNLSSHVLFGNNPHNPTEIACFIPVNSIDFSDISNKLKHTVEYIDYLNHILGRNLNRENKMSILIMGTGNELSESAIIWNGTHLPTLTKAIANIYQGLPISESVYNQKLTLGFNEYMHVLAIENIVGERDSEYYMRYIQQKIIHKTTSDSTQYNMLYGAYLWHMLRFKMGDPAFFSLLKIYGRKCKHITPTTPFLKAIAEAETGESFDSFFENWWYSEKLPTINTHWYTPSPRTAKLRMELTNRNAFKEYKMPIEIAFGNGDILEYRMVWPNKFNEELSFEMPFDIEFLQIDPLNRLLIGKTTTKRYPEIQTDSIPPICDLSTAIPLNFASPSGGTYSGKGVRSGCFIPEKAGIGFHQIHYTLSDPKFGANTVSQTVSVSQIPQTNLPETSSYLRGQALVLSADTGFYSYIWSTGANSQSIVIPANVINPKNHYIYLTANTFEGCLVTDSVLVSRITEKRKNKKDSWFTVFPNPTTGLLKVTVTEKKLRGINMRILNTEGTVIYKKNTDYITGIYEQIELHQQPKGTYYLEIKAGTKKEVVQIILK